MSGSAACCRVIRSDDPGERWFAWRPVRAGPTGRLVWLRYVQRLWYKPSGLSEVFLIGDGCWLYREIGSEEPCADPRCPGAPAGVAIHLHEIHLLGGPAPRRLAVTLEAARYILADDLEPGQDAIVTVERSRPPGASRAACPRRG